MEKGIKKLIEKMSCDNDFKCYYDGIENFNKIKCDFYSNICEGLTKDAEFCKFCKNFGYRNICRCPLIKYLIEKRNKSYLNRVKR